jgi:type II secretory pathway pseudopilin PulG
MNLRRKVVAFSLIEVVVAICVFLVAVVPLLALLPLSARQAAGSRDLQVAARLGDAIRLEAQRLVPPENFATFISMQLVAARDGSSVRLLDPAETVGDQYFLIEIGPYGRSPFQYVAEVPALVLNARVSWPYRPGPPGAQSPPTADGNRERLTFVFALRP